ncbi:hypothetical protein ACFOZ7_16635 [Natribaculum luteum]|uniref:Uncharacterized protein n=1 Tax=Natribaculum luteum TaxID=1586232 RepID=A0ABD5P3L3_9EURY|nr:hypothetical protein [Natribaculum luteum]
MNSAPVLNVIVDNLVEMVDHFSGVATGEALAPLLVLVGTALIVLTLGAFGFLTLGALADLVIPE